MGSRHLKMFSQDQGLIFNVSLKNANKAIATLFFYVELFSGFMIPFVQAAALIVGGFCFVFYFFFFSFHNIRICFVHITYCDFPFIREGITCSAVHVTCISTHLSTSLNTSLRRSILQSSHLKWTEQENMKRKL